jgi:signal transduction histidine kinase
MKNAVLLSMMRSYKGKWLIAIFSFCVVLFLLLIADEILVTRQFLYEHEKQRINHIGNLLTNFIGDNLLDNDTNDVKRIIASSIEQPEIESVELLDNHRIVRYFSKKTLKIKPDSSIDSGYEAKNQDIYYKTFLLNYKNMNLGYLQIGYSMRSIRQNLNISTFRIFAIEALLFFAILFIAWRITGKLLKPLYEMKEVSNKIANGNFSIRAHSTSHDIIGELADALNDMARQLGDLTENMKIRIQEATSDLTVSNSQLIKKTQELEESNRKLKELDRLKSDFVSMVSHELKTPLTSIIGFSKTLLTLKLPTDQIKKYLGIIESEGKRLSRLIEEYLDLSKIEVGQFVMKNETIDMAALVRDVAEPLALKPGPILTIAIPRSLPSINGDREHLKQVLINLIDNAIKYSPPEKEIVISSEELADAVVVRVKDSGPGIEIKDRENLFNKFFRGSDPVVAKTRGSGLGLAIAKGIIEAHKGVIWVESIIGEGSVFCFRLPKIARSDQP